MQQEELCFRHSLPLTQIDLRNSVFILLCKECNRETTEKISIEELFKQLNNVVSNQSAIYKQQHSQYLNQFCEMKKEIKIQKMQLDQCDILIDKMLDIIPKNLSYFEGLQIKINSCEKQFNLFDFENIMEKVSYNDDTRKLNLKENFENILDIQEDLCHLQEDINLLKKTNRRFQKSIKKVEEKQYNEQRFIQVKEDQNGQKALFNDNQEFQWNENPYFEPIEECRRLKNNLMIARTQHLMILFSSDLKSILQCFNPINITAQDRITGLYGEIVGQKNYIQICIDNGYVEYWEIRDDRLSFVNAQKVSNKKGNVNIVQKIALQQIALIGGDRTIKIYDSVTLKLLYQYDNLLLNSITKLAYSEQRNLAIFGNEMAFFKIPYQLNNQKQPIFSQKTIEYFEPKHQFTSKVKFLLMTQSGYVILTHDKFYHYKCQNRYNQQSQVQVANDTFDLQNEPIFCQMITRQYPQSTNQVIYVCDNDKGKFRQFCFDLCYNRNKQPEQKEVNNMLKENLQIKHIIVEKISAYYQTQFYYIDGHNIIMRTSDERWDENLNDGQIDGQKNPLDNYFMKLQQVLNLPIANQYQPQPFIQNVHQQQFQQNYQQEECQQQ